METFYAKNREEWRTWLHEHHAHAKEIWLIYYRKATGKPRVSYNTAVEEAVCFGWIDSQQKGIDEERFAQRFSPRKPGSNWSETNRVRLRNLIAAGKMTPAGLAAAQGVLIDEPFEIPPDIEAALKQGRANLAKLSRLLAGLSDASVWHFIETARNRPEEFTKRLNHLVRLTAKKKMFGYVKELTDKP